MIYFLWCIAGWATFFAAIIGHHSLPLLALAFVIASIVMVLEIVEQSL